MVPLERLINDLVIEIAGSDVIPLIELLNGKENVSEFKLADKLELTVNQVRNMLYKLHSHNLVGFIRKKDKRKGWYIYYWTLDLRRMLIFLISLKKGKIRKLSERLSKRQVQDYFECPKKCVVFDYSEAMEQDFKCPECGSVLKVLDVKRQIFGIKKRINVLKDELKASKEYLVVEEERLLKKKLRAERRAAKKVKRKRKGKKRGRKPKKKRGRPKKVKKRKKTKRKKKKKKVKRKKAKKKKGKLRKKRGRPKKKKRGRPKKKTKRR